MLYQLSYEATHWGWGQFIEFISPVRWGVKWCEVYIWNNSYLNCGCRWMWAMIILHFHLQPQFRYELFHYTSHHFTPHGRYELNKLTSLPVWGSIAQLVEHRTGIAEVTGSNPAEALIFFRLLLSNCLNWNFTAMIIVYFHFFFFHLTYFSSPLLFFLFFIIL